MRIYTETSLKDITYWGGAGETYMELTDDELDYIDDYLTDSYPEGMSDTEVNDFMWFESDLIAELLGYEDWDELEAKHNERWAY